MGFSVVYTKRKFKVIGVSGIITSDYWLSHYIGLLIIETTSSTTQTVSVIIVGAGQTGVSFEYSTDGVNFTEHGTSLTNSYNAAGLTANTNYYWRARLYKNTHYSPYSDTETKYTWTTNYNSVYNAFTTKPSYALAYEQNRIIKDLIAGGWWSKFDWLNIWAQITNTASEALVNWISPGTHNGLAVHAPLFTLLEGFTGDGLNDYIDSTLQPDGSGNYKLNSASFGVYIRTNVAENGYHGVTHTKCAMIGTRTLADSTYLNMNNTTVANGGTINSKGMWIATRTASNAMVLYKNASINVSSVLVSTGLPLNKFFFLAYNFMGVATGFTTAQASIAFIAGGLTLADVQGVTAIFEFYMDYLGKGVSENPYFGSKVADYAVIAGMSLSDQIVLSYGHNFISQGGKFRVPFCELTNNNVLIVGSDVRHGASIDFIMTDVGIIRSEDYGVTWKADQLVFTNNVICSISRKNNASILLDRNTNRLFIFCNVIDNCVVTQYYGSDLPASWDDYVDFVYKYSDDDGATWSSEVSLKSLWGAETNLITSGSGQTGITMADGTLVLPIYESRWSANITEVGADFANRAGIIYSVDNGATWSKSNLILALTNECSIIEYSPGVLMMICRRWDNSNNVRVFTTNNKGNTWTPFTNDNAIVGFVSNRCLHKLTHAGTTRGLITMPASLTDRSKITMYVSSDFITWKEFRELDDESTYGYTCICSNASKLFVVMEKWDGIHLFDMSNYLDAIIAEP